MLVGRDAELARLQGALQDAAGRRGRAVFVAGPAGTGKETLLQELEARADGIRFAHGTCHREHEGQNPYEPFAEILVSLLAKDRSERALSAVLEAVKETAPDWLAMIPVVGAGLQAGVKTGLKLREAYRGDEREEREWLTNERAKQFLAALEGRLEHERPIVLCINQAQWLDAPSGVLLERVVRTTAQLPVAVLATFRPDEMSPEHPLREAEDELLQDDLVQRIDLRGLDPAGVAEYVRVLRGHAPTPALAAWLHEFTDGNPMFISHLLPVLEQHGIVAERDGALAFSEDASADGGSLSLVGRLAGIELPRSVTRAVERRVEQLAAEDVELLEVAAVEGRRFYSSTLARVAEVEERKLLGRLGDFEREHGLIRAQRVLQRRRYAYEFAHLLLQQQMYARLSEPERVDYHLAVAQALVETFGEDAPRPVLLDIARHFEGGFDPGAATGYLLRAAQSALLDGASPEAASLAQRGLELVREASDPALDRVLAELAHVLATASDIGWETDAGGTVEAALADGRAAAQRAGDDELSARLLHAEGVLAIAIQDAAASRRALEESVALARRADAPVTQFAAMIDLGNVIDIFDIDAGLAVLREAHELYLNRLRPAAGEPERDLARLFHRLEGFIGVGEFDRGNLGEARRWLDASVAGLTRLGRPHDLPRLLNYRAQLALARGDFQAARDDLGHALDGALPGPWVAVNQALLAKVAFEAGDEQGAARVREAWAAMQDHWHLGYGLIVRGYLIEYLLRPGSSPDELAEAARLIGDHRRDAEVGGFAYAVAWAESLAAELALREGDPAQALQAGGRAVAILTKDLPVVRTEEVLWRHARCLQAAGSESEAAAFAQRAAEVVERKAASLPEADAERLRTATPTAKALAQSSLSSSRSMPATGMPTQSGRLLSS
jgi:hypothetical protein